MTIPKPRIDPRVRAARLVFQGSVLRAVIWIVGVLVLYYVLPLEPNSDVGAAVRIVVGVALVSLIIVWQIIAVLRSLHPRARAIEALAACTIVVVVVFALAYLNMSGRDPQAFNEPLGRTSALYFTVVTLATIGYGDIAARSDGARIVVMLQVVVNIVILGSAIKLISGLAKRRGGAPGDHEAT